MTFEFDLTVDDIVDFNMHHLRNLESYRRNERRNKLIIALSMLFGSVMMLILERIAYAQIFSIILLFMGTALIFWYSSIMRWSISRKIRKDSEGDDGKLLVGKRRVEIDKYRVTESGDNGESSCLWTAVRAIEKNETMIIVYVSAVSAYILPRRIFESEDAFNRSFDEIVEIRDAIV